MEKISRIVAGNSRVSSSDAKSASPVRPGMPSFGRPVGESTAANPSASSTASRAVALHNDLNEAKKVATQERLISKMADDFFMSRMRGTEGEAEGAVISEGAIESSELSATETGYTPRGSYVDVQA